MVTSYVAGVWYDVQLQFHPSVHHFDVSVFTNGVAVASRKTLNFQFGDVDLSYVYFDGYGGTGHIDNLSIVTVPAPAVLTLLAAGLGGLAWRRRRGASSQRR